MQLKPEKYAPKTGFSNYLNKQNYSDFLVLMTFCYYIQIEFTSVYCRSN